MKCGVILILQEKDDVAIVLKQKDLYMALKVADNRCGHTV
jgi:hypothetical protein